MLLEMILTLERIFQCLIVPHSNTIEWDGQNDMEQVVYFNVQT